MLGRYGGKLKPLSMQDALLAIDLVLLRPLYKQSI